MQPFQDVIPTIFGVFLDALTFLRLCLRPTATVAAENLFLRRQLGLFVERKVKPRRATDSIRFTLGRRLCLLKIPIVRKSLKLSDRAANLRQRCSNYYCPFSSR